MISKYQSILYQAGLFSFVDGEAGQTVTLKKRRATLSSSGEEVDTFVRGYELRVLDKIVARTSGDLGVDLVLDVLGFVPGSRTAADEEYCRGLLDGALEANKDLA